MIKFEHNLKLTNCKYKSPIVLDNKRLRERNSAIDAHFSACKAELDLFPTSKGVIRDSKFIEWVDCPACGSNNTKQWIVKWGGAI